MKSSSERGVDSTMKQATPIGVASTATPAGTQAYHRRSPPERRNPQSARHPPISCTRHPTPLSCIDNCRQMVLVHATSCSVLRCAVLCCAVLYLGPHTDDAHNQPKIEGDGLDWELAAPNVPSTPAQPSNLAGQQIRAAVLKYSQL
jgi:hypothetical protein